MQTTRTCDNSLYSQFLTYIVPVQDASSDECKFAFDALVKPPKDSGYSTECIYSRAQLLKVAADCLVDGESRKHYNARLSTGSSEAQVLHGDMPGALALLQVCLQLGAMCSAMDLEKGDVLCAPPAANTQRSKQVGAVLQRLPSNIELSSTRTLATALSQL